MCILFLYIGDENNPTIICNNRDEYYARATSRGALVTNYNEGKDEENFPYSCSYAPKDLVGGGTWLQFDKIAHPNKPLRYAIVLNFHHWREYNAFSIVLNALNPNMAKLRSRGKLVSEFMNHLNITAKDYAEEIFRTRSSYRPFNLIVSDASDQTYYISSSIKQTEVRRLLPGQIYGVTNGYIDDTWEKITCGKEMVQELVDGTLSQIDFTTIQKIHTQRTPHSSPMEGSFYSNSSSSNHVPVSDSPSSSSKPASVQMLNTGNQTTEYNSLDTSLNPSAEQSLKATSILQYPSFDNLIITPQQKNPFHSSPILTDRLLQYPRIQELLNYEGKVFTHYPVINTLLEKLLEIMSNSQPLADPTFNRSSLPLMQLAGIFVTPTIIVKDEKLTLWTRAFGNGKFRLLPTEINNRYEKIDESEVDMSEIFGTRTITLLVYFDGSYMKNKKKQLKELDEKQKSSEVSRKNSVDSNGCRDVDSVPTSQKDDVNENQPNSGNSTGAKDEEESEADVDEPGLFTLIESDYVLNENENYKLVKSTNVFTNL
jgi:uncharacterized protein with NRDE domain